jgi:hypothetical protein
MKQVFSTILLSSIAMIVTQAALPAQTVYPKGTTIWERGAYDGYTLFVGGDGIVYLIDMDGSVANFWVSPDAGESLSELEALDDGHILVNSSAPGQPKLTALELDFFGNEVWRYEIPPGSPPAFRFHHDSERLADGNTLLLCSQEITIPSISPVPLTDDCIIEIDPAGNTVWSWYTWEHFGQFNWSADTLSEIQQKGGDWAHTNSIDVVPANDHGLPELAEGNIIVSQRQTNTIFIIDRQTGDIVWNLGGDNHLTYGQHDPHMILEGLAGAGNILVFDNGAGTGHPLKKTPAPGYSRVVEIDPVTKTIVSSYTAQKSGLSNFSFWSVVVSGAQRMPNGNTVICAGALGRLFEVAPDGKIVWEYMSPYSGQQSGAERLLVFRAYRMEYSWTPPMLFKKAHH